MSSFVDFIVLFFSLCRGYWLLIELKPSMFLLHGWSRLQAIIPPWVCLKSNLFSALPRWLSLVCTHTNDWISLLQFQHSTGGLLRDAKGPEPQLAAPSYHGLRSSHDALWPAANSHVRSQDCFFAITMPPFWRTDSIILWTDLVNLLV